MRHPRLLFFGLLLLAPISIVGALLSGSADLSLIQLLYGSESQQEILWQLRAPRAASAFACGALLALSGVLLQVLLRNPLADPYLLGISGGAAAGALGAMLLGLAAAVKFSALGGALIALLLVPALSFRRHAWSIHHLLLTGIALSTGFGALISLLLSIAPSAGIHGMLYWLMGDLSYAQSPALTWAALLAAALAGSLLARHLDVLALGDLKAKSLGIAVLPVQAAIYLTAAVATTAAVLEAGSIGFVGLVIPHLLRLAGVDSHRWLIPGAILLGGSFLTLADTLARTLVAPQQLPVGVLTALTGVPLLLFLLSRRR
ncbi:MAG: iron ABC transporter permease [Sulfuricella sp.]|jgi:iron complex transport system permease protein